jgi:hypothetical protein
MYNKMKRGRRIHDREFREDLKLFLRGGSNCEGVIKRSWKRRKRKRTIHKIEE